VDVELGGHLSRGEAKYLAQDQHSPLDRGQVLQHGDEPELDTLTSEIPRLG